MKKILSIIISIMMVMTMVPTMAFAEGDTSTSPDATQPENVAEIDGVGYPSLKAAIDAVEPNTFKEVRLIKETTEKDRVRIDNGKNISLDLGGLSHTVGIFVAGARLQIKNGTLNEVNKKCLEIEASDDVNAREYSVVDIEKDATINGRDGYGVIIWYDTGSACSGAVLNVRGTIKAPGETGIFVQGRINKGHNQVNIYEGAHIEAPYPIIVNGSADVVVEGGTIVGEKAAVALKNGSLEVKGGVLRATGEYKNPVGEELSGAEATGCAISVSSSYDDLNEASLDVKVSGGEIISDNGNALFIYRPLNEGQIVEFTEEANVTITGGKFVSKDKLDSILADTSEKIRMVVSGGEFSTYPEKYVTDPALRKFLRKDGTFAVGTDANKPANSEGMDTWTWNEEANQYEESRVNPPTPSVPSTPEPEVVPPIVDAEGNIETTVKPDASGKVETTVPSDKIEESLDKVTQSPSTDKPVVEIVVKEEEGAKPADSVDVKVPAEAVDKVAKTEDASLKVTTSVGTVELDNKALGKVASEANGEVVTITVEKQDVKEITSEAQKETIESFGKEDYVFEISVRAGARMIRQLEGEMTFEVDYELKEGELPENVRVYCVDEDGNKQRVEARYDEKTKKLVMKTDYLSIFAVSYVDAPSKVKVLKANNEKGKAALRWSRATNGPEGYRIYRAKTKDGKYSPIAWVKDGKAKTFKEKAKKTNKTYYYKVRAYKNVDGKKVWGEYSPVKKLKF